MVAKHLFTVVLTVVSCSVVGGLMGIPLGIPFGALVAELGSWEQYFYGAILGSVTLAIAGSVAGFYMLLRRYTYALRATILFSVLMLVSAAPLYGLLSSGILYEENPLIFYVGWIITLALPTVFALVLAWGFARSNAQSVPPVP